MLRNKLLLLGQTLIEKRRSWFLAPISWAYGLGVSIRNFLYDRSFLKITKVKPIVVSIGNIVAGGTGKTPFVHLLASAFPKRRVAILSRGYGSVPDEAILLARRLPNARVCVGKNRAKLASLLNDVDLILLDDGFQHRKLFRDIDIILTRQAEKHYLPWGFLRDSPNRLKEVGFVFAANQNYRLKVKAIRDSDGKEISSIKGWKVGIFSGIAAPERFKKTVVDLGAELVSESVFADHEIADLAKLPQLNALICTEKDFVKLPKTDLPIYYLEMEMEMIEPCTLWEKLIEKIDQKIDNRCNYE